MLLWSGGTELVLQHGILLVKLFVLQFPFWKVGEKSECVCAHVDR